MGYAYFETFTPRSGNWQWFSDETNETPTAALASENVAPSDMGEQDVTKLRITVHEIADIAQIRKISGQKCHDSVRAHTPPNMIPKTKSRRVI
jgi:hypothetical protein